MIAKYYHSGHEHMEHKLDINDKIWTTFYICMPGQGHVWNGYSRSIENPFMGAGNTAGNSGVVVTTTNTNGAQAIDWSQVLMIGDSNTVYMYNDETAIKGAKHVAAIVGVGYSSLDSLTASSPWTTVPGTIQSYLNSLSSSDFDYVCIMLGTNETYLAGSSYKNYVVNTLDFIKSKNPNAVVNLCTILPCNEEYTRYNGGPGLQNYQIDPINDDIREIVDSYTGLEMHLIDVHSAIPAEKYIDTIVYGAYDGIHLTTKAISDDPGTVACANFITSNFTKNGASTTITASNSGSQNQSITLKQRLTSAINGADGVYSVYAKELKSGKDVILNNIKMPAGQEAYLFVAATVLQGMKEKKIKDSDEVLAALESMLTADGNANSSANALLDVIGKAYSTINYTQAGMNKVNEWAATNGYSNTKIQRKFGLSKYDADEENYTSAKDLAAFFENLRKGKVVQQSASGLILRYLENQNNVNKIPEALKNCDNISKIYNKTAESSDVAVVESDAALVVAGDNAFVVSISVKDFNSREEAIKKIQELTTLVTEELLYEADKTVRIDLSHTDTRTDGNNSGSNGSNGSSGTSEQSTSTTGLGDLGYKTYSLTDDQIYVLTQICMREQDKGGTSWKNVSYEATQMCNLLEFHQKVNGYYKNWDVYKYVMNSGWYDPANHGTYHDQNPTQDQLNAVRAVICEGCRVMPGYVHTHDWIKEMDGASNDGVSFDKYDYDQYVSGKTIVYTSYDGGVSYVFYAFPPDGGGGDPFFYLQSYKDSGLCIEQCYTFDQLQQVMNGAKLG